MHGCLLGFILDPFTRLGALDLLRCSVWLCQAAKLRWGSLHLQINNNDHPGPRYNHGTILPCSHVALVGHLRPKHEEFEGLRHLGYSTTITLNHQHENYGRLSSRMQVLIGSTYHEDLSK